MGLEKEKENGMEIMDKYIKAFIKEINALVMESINGLMDNAMKENLRKI